jgi:hypothetical protein
VAIQLKPGYDPRSMPPTSRTGASASLWQDKETKIHWLEMVREQVNPITGDRTAGKAQSLTESAVAHVPTNWCMKREKKILL